MKEKNRHGILILIDIKQLLISNFEKLIDNLDTVDVRKILEDEIKSQKIENDILLGIIKDEN